VGSRTASAWPLRIFAGLVTAHALGQVVCVASATLAVALTRPRALGAVALSLGAAVLVAWRLDAGHQPRSDDAAPRGVPARAVSWVLAIAAVTWSAAVWARLWRLAWVRPSYDWDGLYYHIPAISAWVAAGHIRWLDAFPDVPFVNYPMGVEAHTFLMHQAFGLPRLVDACNLWYWPLAFFAVVVLARRLGSGGPWPWFASGLLAGVPLLVCQGVTTYIDPASASCVMAAVTTSVLLVFDDERAPGWMTALWGASVGLVLGSKGTGLPMAAVTVALVAAGIAWREGLARWPAWLPRLAAGLCVVLAVGGYWYVRAAYHTGNPVHPVEVRFGSRVLLAGYDTNAMMQGNQPAWLTRYPAPLRPIVSWLQLDAPIEGYAPTGGLGYLWPIAGLPASIWLALATVRRRARDGPPAGFAAVLVLALFLIQPAMWWGRFTVWLHVLGLAALAVALHRAWSARRAVPAALAVIAAVAVSGIAAWESERTLGLERARNLASGSRSDAYVSTDEALFPGLSRTPGFDRLLEARAVARSPWGRAGTLFGGVLALPIGRREIHFLGPAPTEDDLKRLRASGVQWVVWDALGAGPVPEVLAREAVEHVTYTHQGDVELHALRLGP
jgi:hypothetical protein